MELIAQNREQSALWNGCAGHAWVDGQELLDHMFQPFEDLLADAAGARGAASVLDLGCGTGATTIASARRLGPRARCVGIDISQPMLALARARAAAAGVRAEFIHADAQTFDFEPASFDLVISRFGVMFFEDSIAAFDNLRRAVRTGGSLRAMVFRSPAENPFMTAAERAAAPLLPDLPPRKSGPGQFAFADPARVRHILEASGWSGIDVAPLDVACAFPAAELERYVTRLGPVGLALQQTQEPTRSRVTTAVRAAFEPFVRGAQAHFVAACWQVSATR